VVYPQKGRSNGEHVNEQTAKRKIRLYANALRNKCERAIGKKKLKNVRVISWSEFSAKKEGLCSLENIKKMYDENKHFREEARATTQKMVEKKVPVGVKLIFILYALFVVFYFTFGAIFSQLIFKFASLIMGSDLPVSPQVLNPSSQISEILVDSFFPFLSVLLNSNYVYIGLLAVLASFIFLLIAISLIRGINFARIFAIFYSLFEIGLAVTILLEGETLSAIMHFITHGLIVLYLTFSKSVREFFKN